MMRRPGKGVGEMDLQSFVQRLALFLARETLNR
jgi:hypothetical protein